MKAHEIVIGVGLLLVITGVVLMMKRQHEYIPISPPTTLKKGAHFFVRQNPSITKETQDIIDMMKNAKGTIDVNLPSGVQLFIRRDDL